MGPAPIDPPMLEPPAAPLGAGSPPAPTSAPSPTPIRRSEEPPTSTHRPDKLRVRVSEGDGERVGIGRSRHPWRRPAACQSGPGGWLHPGRPRANIAPTGWDAAMQIGLAREGHVSGRSVRPTLPRARKSARRCERSTPREVVRCVGHMGLRVGRIVCMQCSIGMHGK